MFNNKVKEKKIYKNGKWYSIEDLGAFLPGAIIANMFRRPEEGEKTPDGFSSGDDSDYDMCIQSFSITIICEYNATERTDNK